MSLVRIITLLLFAWIGWFLLRNYLAKQQRNSQSGPSAKKPAAGKELPAKIVKCTLCEVHLPEDAAVKLDNNWFCGQPHKQAWLEKR